MLVSLQGSGVSVKDLRCILCTGGISYISLGRYVIKPLIETQKNITFPVNYDVSQNSNKRVFENVSATKLVHRMCKPERRTYTKYIIKRKEKKTPLSSRYNI